MKNALSILLIIISICNTQSDESDEPVLYYYGMEESERGLRRCERDEACGAVVRRAWRPPALLRLCRCARPRRCDVPAPADDNNTILLNNRAYFQFCKPIDNRPDCLIYENALVVETSCDRMDPDELEELHHKNKELAPPKITSYCNCRNPYYWKLNATIDTPTKHTYHCGSLPICRNGEFCGNVSYDLDALYQSCLCPKNHMCVHNGGLPNVDISELLYLGKGWRAYCQRINDDYSYEDY